jgi:hypothetical protein
MCCGWTVTVLISTLFICRVQLFLAALAIPVRRLRCTIDYSSTAVCNSFGQLVDTDHRSRFQDFKIFKGRKFREYAKGITATNSVAASTVNLSSVC